MNFSEPAIRRPIATSLLMAAILLVGRERNRRPPLQLARVALGPSSVEVLEAWKLSRTRPQPENWFWSADEVAEVPEGVLTVRSTPPAAWAGAVTVIWLSE